MTDPDRAATGRRISALRRQRGMSQRELAAAMGRSESWVSQIERGVQPLERLPVRQSLADVLGVAQHDIWPEIAVAPQAEEQPKGNDLDSVRVVLSGHPALGSLFDQTQPETMSTLTNFRTRVDEVWQLAHASSYAELSDRLSTLLPEIEMAVRYAPAAAQAELHALRARVYQAAAASFARQDEADAAWVAADRALQAAELAGQPLEVVAGLFRMAHAFIRQRRTDQAAHAASSAVSVLTPRCEAPGTPPEELSLLGAMHLVLAVINAQDSNRSSTHEHIEEARRIAKRLGGDRNDFDTEFGPTNVELHAVSTAIDLGDAGLALDLAAKIDATALSMERQSRFLVDVARAHAQRRHVGEAVSALIKAEELTPEHVRAHHLVREIVQELVQLSGNRIPEQLARLAERTGVL
ncbi:helix-turn-helix domain-containing protein [Streptomyces sp. NPDC001404]|uniref:helix-turn-helix domain-containing protein n=1 Tax=Streptomyces sp. NPDC001404 TaxID=3364571 RepID=UPI0036A89875